MAMTCILCCKHGCHDDVGMFSDLAVYMKRRATGTKKTHLSFCFQEQTSHISSDNDSEHDRTDPGGNGPLIKAERVLKQQSRATLSGLRQNSPALLDSTPAVR